MADLVHLIAELKACVSQHASTLARLCELGAPKHTIDAITEQMGDLVETQQALALLSGAGVSEELHKTYVGVATVILEAIKERYAETDDD